MSWEDVLEGDTIRIAPGDNVLLIEYDGQQTTCAGTFWVELTDGNMTLLCDVPATLESELWSAAEANRLLELNPQAALLRAMRGDGFLPLSNEFDVSFDGTTYVAQLAQHGAGEQLRVYYVAAGDWGNVQWAG